MRLIFVRHGQTISNIKDICDDDPLVKTVLTKKGEKQAQKAAEKLKDKKIDIIFTSEFFRTNETAHIINKYHNAKIKVDKRLDDRKTGFTGESEKKFIKYLKDSGDFWNAKHGDGESFEDEKKRVINFIEYLKNLHYMDVMIVTHGESIKIIKGYFDNLSNQEMLNLKINNCSIHNYKI
ncbi:MAG: histidine phosphatase family protein [Nanoarchaeota archaeon]|nr:histidine phosphatase family protein [Nanoarchaeota archaeon]